MWRSPFLQHSSKKAPALLASTAIVNRNTPPSTSGHTRSPLRIYNDLDAIRGGHTISYKICAEAVVAKTDKISFNWIEVHLASHCNIRCNGCTHHSPFAKKRFYDIDQYQKDISALSKVADVNLLWLLGGEPLLHPRISDFFEKSKEIGFSKLNAISTNGLLLNKMGDRFFDNIDYIFVALYPSFEKNRGRLKDLLVSKSRLRNFTFNIISRSHFYQIDTDGNRRLSDEEAQKSYENCDRPKKGQFIEDGHFYKCMRPVSTGEYLRNRGYVEEIPDFRVVDGVDIHQPLLKERIESYMASKKCLESCYYCTLGLKKESKVTVWRRIKATFDGVTMFQNIVYRSRSMLYWTHAIQDVFDSLYSRRIAGKIQDIGVSLVPHRLLEKEECMSREKHQPVPAAKSL
jgi:organic radical activating enzyme